MVTSIFRLVLVIALLLQGNFWLPNTDDSERPYHFYLPLVSRPGPCEGVYQDPHDGAAEQKGASFVARWILRNTGESAWLVGRSSIRFVSGVRLHPGANVMDIPYDVEPGYLLDLSISMVAPQVAGRYVSNWAVTDGANILCPFDILISVH